MCCRTTLSNASIVLLLSPLALLLSLALTTQWLGSPLWDACHSSCRLPPARCRHKTENSDVMSRNPSKSTLFQTEIRWDHQKFQLFSFFGIPPTYLGGIARGYCKGYVKSKQSCQAFLCPSFLLANLHPLKKHDGGIIFCSRTSRMSKADKQNSLPKCAGEILDVREEKRWFMLSAYANIPTYHLPAHRMQKQEEERVIYHTARVIFLYFYVNFYIFIINCVLHKHSRRDRPLQKRQDPLPTRLSESQKASQKKRWKKKGKKKGLH